MDFVELLRCLARIELFIYIFTRIVKTLYFTTKSYMKTSESITSISSIRQSFLWSLFLVSCFLLSSCFEVTDDTFGIFTVLDADVAEMNGVIGSSALVDYEEMLTTYPDINTINMREVDGSSDDEINLLVSKKVHDDNMAIHLMDNGLIASGGVDFFLAGTNRTMGSNTQIGVHSWSDGTNEATDFPVGHENHLPYIQYYQSIGFSQSEAEDFYYFTINAAEASSIHWMTTAEIEEYNILTQ